MGLGARAVSAALVAGVWLASFVGAGAQISTDRIEQNKAALATQASDPQWKRTQTIPEDWAYELADGVTTKQVWFYADGGTKLYGKVFYPKGFTAQGSWPGVVVGHGINAISIGIEKYAARFAERGLVAMAIDYQSYGFSDSGSDEIQLREPDTSTDANAVTERRASLVIKRTNLNNVHEVDDFRAAISYLQGEPGLDPNRIGVWGTSNGGSVVTVVTGMDARVKATVVHVMGAAPAQRRPVAPSAAALEDMIRRVQTGQGGETTAGFSFPTKVDAYYTTRNRDVSAGAALERIRPTQAVLFLPAERDELTGGNRSAIAGSDFLKSRGVPSQVITFPGLTHFQPYSGAGFEVGSNLAADWYLKYLGEGRARR